MIYIRGFVLSRKTTGPHAPLARLAFFSGSWRMRLPVAAKIALATPARWARCRLADAAPLVAAG